MWSPKEKLVNSKRTNVESKMYRPYSVISACFKLCNLYRLAKKLKKKSLIFLQTSHGKNDASISS